MFWPDGCRQGTPASTLLSHNSDHLWSTLLGEKGDAQFGPLHIASYVFLGYGFYLLSTAWNVLYHAQRPAILATTGAYARIRHPQYVAFVLILLGFLLQWPTMLTLVMFPILLMMYGRLALTKETDMRKKFGAAFDAYAARTPPFIPSFGKKTAPVYTVAQVSAVSHLVGPATLSVSPNAVKRLNRLSETRGLEPAAKALGLRVGE